MGIAFEERFGGESLTSCGRLDIGPNADNDSRQIFTGLYNAKRQYHILELQTTNSTPVVCLLRRADTFCKRRSVDQFKKVLSFTFICTWYPTISNPIAYFTVTHFKRWTHLDVSAAFVSLITIGYYFRCIIIGQTDLFNQAHRHWVSRWCKFAVGLYHMRRINPIAIYHVSHTVKKAANRKILNYQI